MRALLKKYGPSKEQIWNLLLVLIGSVTLYLLVESQATEIQRKWAEQRELANQKSEFVEDFATLGSTRIYLAEVYYLNKSTGEDQQIIEDSWDNYMTSVIEWNKRNITNQIFINEFSGVEMKDRFHNDLLRKLVRLHEALLAIREGGTVENIDEILEDAKHEMFVFSENLMFD